MACGKTTLGRAVAQAGVADFLDLDEIITARSGLSPAQWFEKHGEKAFRDFEILSLRHVIDSFASSDRQLIVACGGGTPANGGAMDMMLSNGTVVWLEASLGRTIDRLLDAPGQRPIVDGMDRQKLLQFIPAHLASRVEFYRKAHARFDSSFLDSETEIAASVAQFVSQFLSDDSSLTENN